jgi:hypothetical protein
MTKTIYKQAHYTWKCVTGTILWTDVDVEIATRKMRVDGCLEKGSQAKKHYRPIETIG